MVIHKKNKRILIQTTAIHIFNERGYHQTRIEDISKKARLGKGTFYLYFKNKEELVLDVLNEFVEKFNELHNWVSAEIKEQSNPQEVYLKEGRYLVDLLEKNKSFGLFLLKQGHSVSDEFSQTLNEFYNIQRAQASASYDLAKKLGFMKDIDTQYAAAFVVGSISHIYELWLEEKIKDSGEKILEKCLRIFLKFLL